MKTIRTAISSLRWMLLLWALLGMCGVSLLFSGIWVVGLVGAGLLAWVAYWVWRYLKQVRAERAPNLLSENAYCILGVKRDADAETIRKAFRQLVQQHHPDVVPPDMKEGAAAIFVRISQAYELLSDREKRFQYDGWIDDLEGDIPAFDEAYARLKDEHKHPIYAAYDALNRPDDYRHDWRWAADAEGRDGIVPIEEDIANAPGESPARDVMVPESVVQATEISEAQANVPEPRACSRCGRPREAQTGQNDAGLCDDCATA